MGLTPFFGFQCNGGLDLNIPSSVCSQPSVPWTTYGGFNDIGFVPDGGEANQHVCRKEQEISFDPKGIPTLDDGWEENKRVIVQRPEAIIAKLVLGEDVQLREVMSMEERVAVRHARGRNFSEELLIDWVKKEWGITLGTSPKGIKHNSVYPI